MTQVDLTDLPEPEARTPGPKRGPFVRWPRASDSVLAVFVFVVEALAISARQAADTGQFTLISDLPAAGYGLLAAGSGALIFRRRLPLVVLGLNLAAGLLWEVSDYVDGPLIAILISLYGVGRYITSNRRSYAAIGAMIVLGNVLDVIAGEPALVIAIGLILTFLPWYVGRRFGARGEYLAVLEERATYLERERAAEAERAVSEERSRIARELHDVVAHRVSMMTVQAGAAKTVAATDPDGAYQAMEAVELAGRQALGELRHLLGVLRPGPDTDGLAPQLGLSDLPQLIDQLNAAGIDATYTTDGVPADLPAQVDLSAYRITQEALTNVVKHAGSGAKAEVKVSAANHEVIIEVADRGVGATILPGSGHGLIGMRERALLLGGTLDAGPRRGGGFLVTARLPIGEDLE